MNFNMYSYFLYKSENVCLNRTSLQGWLQATFYFHTLFALNMLNVFTTSPFVICYNVRTSCGR